ncbi:MAG: epoxyqueuosine reductase QueH [Campylobacterales bacterium]|nr:epoxyqueuosine reductase QueH [Campylobacterales bacterium]
MLVHICCSVDSHYFLQRLKEQFPQESLVGFFYNPNIHPYEEYLLRLGDVRRSCQELGIALLEGEYALEAWLEEAKGLECEPEKGKRCEMCFTTRLNATAKKATELGITRITTTLLMSPKKSLPQLEYAAKEVERAFGVSFVAVDFRKGGGTQAQFALAKEAGLYQQNYCGCVFALTAQREAQNKPCVELASSLNNQVQPGSIGERLALYETPQPKRRQRFLNYRLDHARVMQEEKVIPSHVLFYSLPSKPLLQGEWKEGEKGIAVFSKEPALMLTLEAFNTLAMTTYSSVKEVLASPLSVEKELHVRQKLEGDIYSFTPILVVEHLPQGKTTLAIEATLFHDVRELLATFR